MYLILQYIYNKEHLFYNQYTNSIKEYRIFVFYVLTDYCRYVWKIKLYKIMYFNYHQLVLFIRNMLISFNNLFKDISHNQKDHIIQLLLHGIKYKWDKNVNKCIKILLR
jgi:hypothetical protein